MLDGELAQGLQDILFDLLTVPIRAIGMVGEGQGREIRRVDRVVDGDGELKLCVVVNRRARDTSPHRLITNA